MAKRCTIFPASRETINNNLLMAIDGDEHVAIVLSKTDLDELLSALGTCRASSPRIVSMEKDLHQLRASAFPTHHDEETRP